MKRYFDTSVLAALVLRDDDWGRLRDWLTVAPLELTYSDFTAGEFASAVGRRVRMEHLSATEARKILSDLPTLLSSWCRIDLLTSDVSVATGYTGYMVHFTLGLRFPDAIHIAIAQRLDCALVTSDRRQYQAAKALGVRVLDPYLSLGTESE